MVAWAAVLLGFGLGGLVDGILLHQVLQWHHLASAAGGSEEWQVRLDGLFHLAVLGVTGLGLVVLWAGRAEWADAQPRAFWGAMLAAFGGFHVIDGLVFHWGLGLHHIVMGSPGVERGSDLAAFAFGVAVTAGGLALVRSARRRAGRGL